MLPEVLFSYTMDTVSTKGGFTMKKIKTVLVANRGEIAIRVFRACNELGIRTVAIYSKEDTLSLHRNRADEAYLVGEGKGPIDAYLDIEDIMRIAREHDVDAIHPGYGFLSENSQLAKRCAEEGFIFIGPRLEHLIMFGDKINARTQAELAGIPMIPGSTGTVSSVEEVRAFAGKHGFPIIIKAVNGGGGRGMRMVASMDELDQAYSLAKSEALKAFGSDEIYLEKYLQNPKHIEVQIIGDTHGNIVHLHERDCSVQRRHQKLVEVAPAFSLPQQLRSRICEAAVKLMKNVDYISAGTVEFLATPDNNFYFIEVNPRIQVEHTVTEEITGIDIVQTQIKIAEGYSIHDPEIAIPEQKDIITHGHAIQCRITTEDPANNFMPDTGKLIAYRSGGGFGVRLDGGNAFTGSVITPYYDSLLVKATTWGLTHQIAISKMLRCLKEFRIRGVKTNILFLENVLQHPQFTDGSYSTKFVDDNTDLFIFPKTHDRGTKLLNYIADISINGYSNVGVQPKPEFAPLNMPKPFIGKIPDGSKQVLDAHGPAGLAKWVQAQSEVLITDTTFRDAHQSLFATRLRTNDMMKVAAATAGKLPNLFSFECWGGATFDACLRFLDEDPWERLRTLKKHLPKTPIQMLLRGQNILGYSHYADDVVKEFVKRSVDNGVSIIRIFDALNDTRNMECSMRAAKEAGAHVQGAFVYTISPYHKDEDFLKVAQELVQMGADSICIKDMAGLLSPYNAEKLVRTLKSQLTVPIDIHTHFTSGMGDMTYLKAIEAGVDMIDTALSPFAQSTGQPSTEAIVATLQGQPRDTGIELTKLHKAADYFRGVKTQLVKDFGLNDNIPIDPKVLTFQIPGGMLSNLLNQMKEMGSADKYPELLEEMPRVRAELGYPPLVTPTSQIVGSMAALNVTLGRYKMIPNEVKDLVRGKYGRTPAPIDPEVKKLAIGDEPQIDHRPADDIAPQMESLKAKLAAAGYPNADIDDVLSYALFPDVALAYFKKHR